MASACSSTAFTTEEETRIAKWCGSHGTGEAAALEFANLGEKQLERSVDSLKGVLVFDAFVAHPLTPAAKPLEKAEAKLPDLGGWPREGFDPADSR